MGTAAARALILQRIQLHGSNHLVHPASSARQLNSGPLSVPPFTRSNWNPVSRNSNWVDACKSFNLSTATEFTIHTNNSIVTRAGLAPARFGSPRADLLVSSYGFSQGLASVMCYNSSVASTSGSSERHQAQESRYLKFNKGIHGVGTLLI